MNTQRKGVLFVVSGPSGVGKGTLKEKLLGEFGEEIAFSVSATTRGPRPGEIDGKDYFFITRQEFEARIANHDFLEHAEFSANLYGTPRPYVEKLLSEGKNVLLEIEVLGAMQVMASMPECVSVFILPPSMEELERRLRGRGTESEEVIARRLKRAKEEIEFAPRYDYRVINGDDLEAAYQEMRAIYVKHTR